MLATMVRIGLRQRSLVQIRRVAPVPFDSPEPTVFRVYRDVEREFGVLAPPIALHAQSPDVMSAIWVMLRESLIAPGLTTRAEKEAVAATISQANACPYCVTMHTSMMDSLGGVPTTSTVGSWAQANAVRGTTDVDDLPFPEEHAAELVAVAVLLHYLNRMVNIFLGEAPLPPKTPAGALKVVKPVLNWLQRSAERDSLQAGTSLDLLPTAALPADVSWTEDNAVLADAFSRGTAVLDAAGERTLSPAVRELVLTRLKTWDGRPLGLSRAWVEADIAELPSADQAAGRLALLTAFASYQIDDGVVEAFRARAPEDRSLIDCTAWASMAAAREAGSWMLAKR
jgi:AhpD family alkylhydroperoxidase